ncbi:hypothetical protein [Wukongibacter sp. M2B1]|uniref:hypothetical protein n=1 Tax=Wukongibacter sp. M2B1 TaxID=3088895 RepID=UPI003D7B41B3
MGDGRYYSLFQFINILILTLCMGISVFLTVYFSLKSRTKAKLNYIVKMIIIVYFYGFILFLDEVIFSYKASYFFKQCFLIIVVLLIMMWIIILQKKNKSKTLFTKIIALVVCIFIATNRFHNLVFNMSDFEKVDYNVYVITPILFSGLLVGIIRGIRAFKIYNDKKIKKEIILINIVTFIQLLCIWIYIIGILPYKIKIHIYTLPFLLFVIVYSANGHMPSLFIPKIFRNIIDNYNDLLIVCDKYGKIIFENSKNFPININADYLLFPNNIHKCFKDSKSKIINIYENGIEIEVINDDKEIYVMANYRELISNDSSIGYVYNIVDITPHYNILENLNKRVENLEKVNKDLKNYSETEIILFEEKERKKILTNLQQIIGDRVADLLIFIQHTKNTLENDQRFLITINTAIKEAREILEDVRKVVRTLYSREQGVKND